MGRDDEYTHDPPLSQKDWVELCSWTKDRWGFDSVEYMPAPQHIADHLAEFLAGASTQLAGMSADQVDGACNAVFTIVNGWWEVLLEFCPIEDQVRVYRSFEPFSVTEVPRFCPDTLDDARGDAVYMIWDTTGVARPLHNRQVYPEVYEAILAVFRSVLRETTHAVCVRSVLHGLFDTRFGDTAEINGFCRSVADDPSVPPSTRASLRNLADRTDVHP